MYAIVEMKGQQFRVEAGKKLFINRMNELEKGATVEFENVLLLDNEGKVKVGAPYVKCHTSHLSSFTFHLPFYTLHLIPYTFFAHFT